MPIVIVAQDTVDVYTDSYVNPHSLIGVKRLSLLVMLMKG